MCSLLGAENSRVFVRSAPSGVQRRVAPRQSYRPPGRGRGASRRQECGRMPLGVVVEIRSARGRAAYTTDNHTARRTRHGRRHHAPAARERRPLRAPDPPLEPEDEALHPHRAQRHLHHRPAAVADVHRQRLRVRQGDGRPRRHHPLRRHEEAGPGADRRAGDARRPALRQPALARWHAHQLPDGLQAPHAPQGARGARLRRRRRLGLHEEGAPRS